VRHLAHAGVACEFWDDATDFSGEMGQVVFDAAVVQPQELAAGQGGDVGWQLTLGWHAGVVDEDRDHPNPQGERLGDFSVHPVGLAAHNRTGAPADRHPVRTDQGQQHRTHPQVAEDLAGEVVPGQDGLWSAEDRALAETGGQVSSEQGRVTGLFPGSVVDEDLGHGAILMLFIGGTHVTRVAPETRTVPSSAGCTFDGQERQQPHQDVGGMP